MSIGSGLFSNMLAHLAHLVKPGSGLDGELFDLRKDIATSLSPLVATAVEEWTTPVGTAAPGASALLVATATSVAVQTKLRAALIAAGLAQLALWPRPVTFTTLDAPAGAPDTATDAPATATITGIDANGAVQVEVVNVAQTDAGVATSVGVWSDITSIVYSAGQGVGATVSIGIAAAFIYPATATSMVPVTLHASQLLQGDLARYPRGLVFTGGGVAAHAPTLATVTGRDINGRPVVEAVVLTAGAGSSATSFAHIDSIAYNAGTVAADATVAITFTDAIGFSRHIKTRLALTQLSAAIIGGLYLIPSTPMTGVVAPPVATAEYTGTVDISSAAAVAALNGLTVLVQVNGAPHTITFAAPVTIFDVVAQARTQAPGLQVSLTDHNTHLRFEASRTLVIAGGTANAAIGFPAGPTTAPSALPNGTYAPLAIVDGATSLAVYYEFDASFDNAA